MEAELFDAVKNNELFDVRNLLKQGVYVNVRDRNGETPIFSAVKNGNLAMIDLLIYYHADVNLFNQDDMGLLVMAIQMNRIDIVDHLLKAGADINAGYYNPLRVAVGDRLVEMCKFLIDNGANPLIMGARLIIVLIEETALDPDLIKFEQILTLLLSYRDPRGYKININDYDDTPDYKYNYKIGTPLSMAIDTGNIDIIRILLDHGANPNYIVIDDPEIQQFIDDYFTEDIKLAID